MCKIKCKSPAKIRKRHSKKILKGLRAYLSRVKDSKKKETNSTKNIKEKLFFFRGLLTLDSLAESAEVWSVKVPFFKQGRNSFWAAEAHVKDSIDSICQKESAIGAKDDG